VHTERGLGNMGRSLHIGQPVSALRVGPPRRLTIPGAREGLRSVASGAHGSGGR
jgi:hypothetical protein